MPTIIPKVIAKANPLKTSPPKINTATIDKRVVPEVFKVLERVLSVSYTHLTLPTNREV